MANIVKDYRNLFDIESYLTYFKDPKAYPWVLEKLHVFWKKFNSAKNLSLLEYGGGPNISRLVSACQYVESIVFSEHVDVIRQAVHDWIAKKGFDWKATFDFVVQDLEGQDQLAASNREDVLRSKIKAVVPCDITANNPLDTATLPAELHPPYDVVFTSCCLEAVVESDQEYKEAVSKLARLVKPGGSLVMHGVLEQSFFRVGEYNFYSYKLNKTLIEDSLKSTGIKNIVFDIRPILEKFPTFFDAEGEFFVYGERE